MKARAPGIVRVRAVKDYERQVSGTAARYPTPAYLVSCRICPPGKTAAPGDFFASLLGDMSSTLGWAPSWEMAMRFADAHASLHGDRACPTCAHVPDSPVSVADTQAVMRARA